MARKRATPATKTLPQDPGAASSMAALRTAFVDNFKGKKAKHAPEHLGQIVYGLSLEGCLPLQYILGIDVLPLGQTIALVGKPESLKSLMGWYLVSRVLSDSRTPGMAVYLAVEKKTNDPMIRGIIQNDNLYEHSVMRVPINVVPEMCTAMQEYAVTYRKAVPDNEVPLVYFLDSMGALTNQEAIDAMNKTGDASTAKGYNQARAAADLTQHFQTWVPENLQKLPLALIYVNHLKEKIGEDKGANFSSEKTSPGGVHKDYMNVATIEMIRERGYKSTVKEARAKVWMRTQKSSFADSGLKVSVIMNTTGPDQERYPDGDLILDRLMETEEDFQRMHVLFDWDTSLAELLIRDKGTTWEKSRLDEVCAITGKGNDLNCKQLGLKGVDKRELGAAIHADPAVYGGVQSVLGIFRHKRFGS